MAFDGWVDGIPPREWERLLSIDVGGASPWAFLWTARDPQGYLVVYEEIYETTTDVEKLANRAKPLMVHPEGPYPHWRARIIDYENKIAAEDLRRRGIMVTNAVKHDKVASIHRLASYLHPNLKRPFPGWHPKSGQPGSPLLFIMTRCKNLIRELPQQRWKEGQGDSLKDEMDRAIDNHAVDALLYTVRILPHPSEIKPQFVPAATLSGQALMSKLYHEDRKRHEEQKRKETVGPRRKYSPGHRQSSLPR